MYSQDMPLCELRYFSEALGKHTGANVILPAPNLPGPYPVMFLLHGLSDDYTIWLRRTSIERYVDGLPLIVVMPDGGRGFYCDAINGFKYNTAIGVELPRLIRNYFPCMDEWCISGLSMGGYGAIRLALDYPELFVSATSHSGALYFGHHPLDRDDEWNREFERIVGKNPEGGPNDLLALAERLDPDRRPQIRIDCGTEDFLLEANRAYSKHLNSIGYVHEYEEFPGGHDWSYWDLHIQESIAFHRNNLGI